MSSPQQHLDKILRESPQWLSSQDSMWDVATTLSVGPICLILRSFIRSRYYPPNKWQKYLFDFLFIVFPILLSFTLFSDHSGAYLVSLLLLILCFAQRVHLPHSLDEVFPLERFGLSYLNSYRALVNLCTVVVILAVDFPALFPVRFHKRYTRGFSLMDTGVGSFVFSHALVSAEARHKEKGLSVLKRIKATVLSSSVLLILGLARLFVTWITDYAVSEDEYGKHWNFFFTLASVKILVTVVFCVLPLPAYSGILGVVLGTGYQLFLSGSPLKEWILTGDDGSGQHTGGFLNANRPGIFSSVGFCALYLVGVQVGRYLFRPRDPTWRSHVTTLHSLLLTASSASLLAWLAHTRLDPASRMIANLSYASWQVAHNCLLLSLALVADLISATLPGPVAPACCCQDGSECACVLTAVNKNQLFFFLVGNVLTGLVNLSVSTGEVGVWAGMGVMTVYCVAVTGVVVVMLVRNVSTKFW